MNHKFLFPFILAGLLAMIAPLHYTEAVGLKSLAVKVSQDINKDCRQPADYAPIRGCYLGDTNQLFVSAALPSLVAQYVFLREMGHFFLFSMSDEDLLQAFHPTPDKLLVSGIRDIAAEEFVTWFLHGTVPVKEQLFFTHVLQTTTY